MKSVQNKIIQTSENTRRQKSRNQSSKITFKKSRNKSGTKNFLLINPGTEKKKEESLKQNNENVINFWV